MQNGPEAMITSKMQTYVQFNSDSFPLLKKSQLRQYATYSWGFFSKK